MEEFPLNGIAVGTDADGAIAFAPAAFVGIVAAAIPGTIVCATDYADLPPTKRQTK